MRRQFCHTKPQQLSVGSFWFSLSDEGVEEAIYDSDAMRRFMVLGFAVEQVPGATMRLGFRHLIEEHKLAELLFAAQNRIFDGQGWIMRGTASLMP